jgi:hypothetical protein
MVEGSRFVTVSVVSRVKPSIQSITRNCPADLQEHGGSVEDPDLQCGHARLPRRPSIFDKHRRADPIRAVATK